MLRQLSTTAATSDVCPSAQTSSITECAPCTTSSNGSSSTVAGKCDCCLAPHTVLLPSLHTMTCTCKCHPLLHYHLEPSITAAPADCSAALLPNKHLQRARPSTKPAVIPIHSTSSPPSWSSVVAHTSSLPLRSDVVSSNELSQVDEMEDGPFTGVSRRRSKRR